MKKYIIATIAFIAITSIAGALYYQSGSNAPSTKDSTPTDSTTSEGALNSAEVVIPIDNVSRNGKVINLTITENAREYDDKASSVKISAMKKVSADNPTTCPKVSSTAINKSIDNYNMVSGKAQISATFTNADIAKKVEEADCLLIENEE